MSVYQRSTHTKRPSNGRSFVQRLKIDDIDMNPEWLIEIVKYAEQIVIFAAIAKNIEIRGGSMMPAKTAPIISIIKMLE